MRRVNDYGGLIEWRGLDLSGRNWHKVLNRVVDDQLRVIVRVRGVYEERQIWFGGREGLKVCRQGRSLCVGDGRPNNVS